MRPQTSHTSTCYHTYDKHPKAPASCQACVAHHLHHVVHGHHLCAAQVEGLLEVALGDAQDALHAVVDEGEGASLLAIAPHLQLAGGSQHLQRDA